MPNTTDDQDLVAFGYKPQLHRNLNFVASFTASFSMMSVLMGVFSNYGYVLTKAGAFGIWSWLLVAVGQAFVALVFAEMAGRIPLTGAIYNWNSKLVSPMVGWLTGWLTALTYIISIAGLVTAMMTPLQTFLGLQFSPHASGLVGAGVILLLAVTNIYGVRLAAQTNKFLVIIEMIALLFFGLGILGIAIAKGETHFALVTTIPQTPTPYLPGFLMSVLLGAWTIFGFEIPSDLSEETLNVKRVAPKSILSSVLATGILGMLFLFILTLTIPDMAAVSAAADPVSAIVSYYLGDTATKIFLFCAILAIFGCAIMTMAAASRIVFAIARDDRFVAASQFSRITSHHTPAAVIALVAFAAAALWAFANSATSLYATPIILLSIVYLTTIVSVAVGIRKLPPVAGFSLGRWRWPVIVLAIVWLVSMIGIVTIPDDFHDAATASGFIILIGFILYPIIGRNKTA